MSRTTVLGQEHPGLDLENPRDPGYAVLDALRRFEPLGRPGRREFLATLAMFAGGAPLMAQDPVGRTSRTTFPRQYSAKVMEPVNIHEIRAVAERTVNHMVAEYIIGGVEDELTLTHNLEAFRRTWLRQRVMVDVSNIDTTLDLLGVRLDFPILLDPTTKNNVIPQGDRVSAVAAHECNALYCISNASWMAELDQANQAPVWWASTLGHATRMGAQNWARTNTDMGAKALAVTVDHQYTPNRDRNIRTGYPGGGRPPNYLYGSLRPTTPRVTWQYLEWLRSGSSLPLVVKGILTGEDADLAAQHGAAAIIVSNHGGRAMEGTTPTLMALPECVDAVGGRIPVLIDGGLRRGGDVLKALALGATAVLVGRPYVWGLAAFGQVGVQRVVELLHAELKVAMGIAGAPNLAAINRDLVRLPWEQ